jgi:NADH dehydrogenase FAD-containing subunit
MNSPLKSNQLTVADGIKEATEIQEAISKASSVAIVGGGSVGIEVAGEIATDHPNIKVTLIHGASELLNNSPYITPKTKQMALEALKKRNVEVVLNARVKKDSEGHLLPGGKPVHLSSHILTTEDNQQITSDVQILAIGIAKPNSDLAASLASDLLDEKGYIKVKKTGQLHNFQHMFALGDVSDLDDVKMAAIAFMGQAPKIASNITTLIKTKKTGATVEPKLVEYAPVTPSMGAMMVTIGRAGGVAQLPFVGTFGDWVTRTLKSQTMFVDSQWKVLNVGAQYPK